MRLRTLATAVIAATGMLPASVVPPAQAAEQRRVCVVDLPDGGMVCHDSATTAAATRADTIIWMGYTGSDFAGSVYVVSVPYGCTATLADVDWSMQSLPWIAPDIRSYRSFSGCWARHYAEPDFQGVSTDWGGGGNLPFPARSIQWS